MHFNHSALSHQVALYSRCGQISNQILHTNPNFCVENGKHIHQACVQACVHGMSNNLGQRSVFGWCPHQLEDLNSGWEKTQFASSACKQLIINVAQIIF